MQRPSARGPLSAAVLTMLTTDQRPDPADFAARVRAVSDPLADGDLQLALACCYELHYRGLEGVDDAWEWDPDLLALRSTLEAAFEHALPARPVPRDGRADRIWSELRTVIETTDGPAVSTYLARHGRLDQFRDFLVQRSIYHLREADPHTWAIPRLSGKAKAALVEIQADEYGGGQAARMHSELFAQTLRTLGLDDTYGHYWDEATPQTLATVNLMSLFGLHRRHRGALAGHLAALEMTSTEPNRKYGNGLRRLGLSTAATAFFDEHVEADAVHEQLASVDLCGSLVTAEPRLRPDILWGAHCCLLLDARAGAALLSGWGADEVPAVA